MICFDLFSSWPLDLKTPLGFYTALLTQTTGILVYLSFISNFAILFYGLFRYFENLHGDFLVKLYEIEQLIRMEDCQTRRQILNIKLLLHEMIEFHVDYLTFVSI